MVQNETSYSLEVHSAGDKINRKNKTKLVSQNLYDSVNFDIASLKPLNVVFLVFNSIFIKLLDNNN